MKYHELNLTRQRLPKRVGRGISAGQGKTAGRGTKGQGARKSPVRAGFEGGQTPLALRLPKLRGFKSHRPQTVNVYTGQLDAIKPGVVDSQSLFKAGLVPSPYLPTKLVQRGELKGKFSVKLQAASQGAIKAVEKAGGSFEKVERLPRPTTKTSKTEQPAE